MSGDIVVEINGKKATVPQGSTIADCLAASGHTHVPGTVIGIISGREEARKEVATEFRIITSKGELKLELTGDLKQAWLDSYGNFSSAPVKWVTGDALSFGPAPSGIQPGRGEADYRRWDVCFGTGGYEARNSYLIISRNNHSSDYGAKGGGVFGRVISGKSVIASLGQDDSITGIEPVMKLEKSANNIVTEDTSIPAEDGMEIHSEIEIELLSKAKDGAEHFYAAVKDGTFPVDFVASTFISSDVMIAEISPYENLAARSEGTVSVRTDGSGRGRIYISKGDMTSNVYHSIIGSVTRGIELSKMASAGQRLAIKTVPVRLSVLGMGLAKAEEFLARRGIKYEKSGYEGEDAIVVDQTPRTTMEIVSAGNVKIASIPEKSLIDVRLYNDRAGQSAEYFRRATGLKEQSVGALGVFFKYEDTVLFKGKNVLVGELIPENKPEEGESIAPGEIGLTNTAAKNSGLIGVRFSQSVKFGPTGEKYAATNIVGRVLDLEKLKKIREKDTVYFREV